MCAARSTWSRRHRQQGSAAKRYNRRLAGLDGVNVRGAVVLAETPGSLTIVTLAGNPSPVDLLHLATNSAYSASIAATSKTPRTNRRNPASNCHPNLQVVAFSLKKHGKRTLKAMQTTYNGLELPKDGQAIDYKSGQFEVPDHPIIPSLKATARP